MGCGVSSICPPLASHSFASVAPAKAAALNSWAGSFSASSPSVTPAPPPVPPRRHLRNSPESAAGDSLHRRYTLFGSPIFRSASCQDAYRALFITMSQDGETLIVEQYTFPPSPNSGTDQGLAPAWGGPEGWPAAHSSNLELPPPDQELEPKRAASLPDLRGE